MKDIPTSIIISNGRTYFSLELWQFPTDVWMETLDVCLFFLQFIHQNDCGQNDNQACDDYIPQVGGGEYNWLKETTHIMKNTSSCAPKKLMYIGVSML
jgi:hypothetical protein